MPNWDENSPRLHANISQALRLARDSARAREEPSLELPRQWHAQIMNGLTPTHGAEESWYGMYRGEPGQEFIGVRVGGIEGAPPHVVSEKLNAFIDSMKRAVAKFDDELLELDEAGNESEKEFDEGTVSAIIGLMAFAHGEWVRIDTFANGNGRTARLWANWIAIRYGLPPFVTLRPRPGREYEQACAKAMSGHWRSMRVVFEEMLDAMANELLP